MFLEEGALYIIYVYGADDDLDSYNPYDKQENTHIDQDSHYEKFIYMGKEKETNYRIFISSSEKEFDTYEIAFDFSVNTLRIKKKKAQTLDKLSGNLILLEKCKEEVD